MFTVCVIIIAGIVLVLFKLYDIQIVKFKMYQDQAIQQQTRDIPISPDRGIIYDRNMKILASNAPVEQVFIAPAELDPNDKTTARLAAQGLSEILGVDYEETYNKFARRDKKDINIKHYVEISVANQLRQYRKNFPAKMQCLCRPA